MQLLIFESSRIHILSIEQEWRTFGRCISESLDSDASDRSTCPFVWPHKQQSSSFFFAKIRGYILKSSTVHP
jgi:hypothetical protein